MNAITQTTTKATKTKTSKATKAKVMPTVEVKQEVAKVETKAASNTFTLVAGTVADVSHKGLAKAIAYHVGLGNLVRTDQGVKLTAQGAAKFYGDRVANDPATFQRIAKFVRGKGETPQEYKGQPITQVGDNIQFPNMLYWGSFSSGLMRKCFAAIWASPQ